MRATAKKLKLVVALDFTRAISFKGENVMNTYVKFKKLNEDAIVPKYGSDNAACADLYACTPMPLYINPGETRLIKTGIAMEIPEGLGGFIFARSGMATKQGLAPANKVGVIDPDYRGEIMVALHNHSQEIRTIGHGERIAQIGFMPYVTARFIETEELDDTTRGAGGFGSTGTN